MVERDGSKVKFTQAEMDRMATAVQGATQRAKVAMEDGYDQGYQAGRNDAKRALMESLLDAVKENVCEGAS